MKRFTETDKWRDKWFRRLEPMHKLAYLFILDNCDGAGVIEFDEDECSFNIGGTLDLCSFNIASTLKIAELPSGKLWVKNFCEFQYPKGINSKWNVCANACKSIRKNKLPVPIDGSIIEGSLNIDGILDEYSANVPSTGTSTGNGKGIGKEEEASDLNAIQIRIAKLGSWSPHLSYSEQSELADNAGKWFDLTDRDWNTLESWYAVPAAAAPYRSGKAKLLRSPDEEVIKAESNGFPKSAKSKAKLSPAEKAEMNQKLFGETVIATDAP